MVVGSTCLSPNVSSYYWTGLQCLTLYIIDHAVIDAMGRAPCQYFSSLDGRRTFSLFLYKSKVFILKALCVVTSLRFGARM